MVIFGLTSASSPVLVLPPAIVREGLAVYFDAADPQCYNPSNPRLLNDLSGHGIDGTLTSTDGNENSSKPYVDNGVVTIKSTESNNAHYVKTDYTPEIYVPSTDYTFELWFKDEDGFKILHNTTDPTTSTTLISNFGGGGNSALLHILGSTQNFDSKGSLLIAERTGGTNVPPDLFQTTLTEVLDYNRWYHIVMTADSTNIRVYIDGVVRTTIGRRTTIPDTQAYNSKENLRFIRFGGGFQDRGQTCLLGPMRVYMGKALTGAEVLNNFNVEKGRFPNP